MNKIWLVVLAAALVLAGGALVQTFAEGDAAQQQQQQMEETFAAQYNMHGELLEIDGDFYVVKDPTGKEVRLHVDDSTNIIGSPAPGTNVKADVSASGHARTLAEHLASTQ